MPNRSPKYKVSLKLPDKTYSKSASTPLQAIQALQRPVFFKSKGIIQLTYGKLKAETWMYPVLLRKLFNNPMSKQLLAKRLSLALK